MKTKWLLTAFGIAHILIIIVLFNSSLYDHRYPAAPLYFDYASQTVQGLMPYRDFSIEYPPLALPFFILPRLFTSNIDTYSTIFNAEILIFDLIGLFLVAAIARRFKQSVELSLAIYTLALLSVGPIVNLRYDVIPAIMVLAAIYALYRDRHKTAWAMLALGTMTKIYPAVVAPVFLVYYLRKRQYRSLLTGAATFVIVALLTALPFLIQARGGLIDSFKYQALRGLQIESSYASVLLFLNNLRLVPMYLSFNWGAWNVSGPIAENLARLSTPITLGLLFAVYLLFLRNQRGEKSNAESEIPPMAYVMNYSALAIAVFIAAGKVLSPQFIVWLYPLIPVIVGSWRYVSWAVFMVIGLMTYYIFPTHYLDVLLFQQTALDILLWRNILLVALGALLIMKSTPRPVELDETCINLSEVHEDPPR